MDFIGSIFPNPIWDLVGISLIYLGKSLEYETDSNLISS